jgi:hypothetical protein
MEGALLSMGQGERGAGTTVVLGSEVNGKPNEDSEGEGEELEPNILQK